MTDSTLTGGAPGVISYGAATADNWAGGTGSPPPPLSTYSIGGTVSGLSGTVVLQDDGGDDLSVSSNGPFTFATPVADGAAYDVTVKSNPSDQTCTTSNGSGTVASANVTSVSVTCTTGPRHRRRRRYRSSTRDRRERCRVVQLHLFGRRERHARPQGAGSDQPGARRPAQLSLRPPGRAGVGHPYGDGLETLRSLDAQDEYNLTIIEPSFAIDPWYADNPTDPNLQYETFMTKDLVPWVTQNLAGPAPVSHPFGTVAGDEQNWLIGFSKSGIGGPKISS